MAVRTHFHPSEPQGYARRSWYHQRFDGCPFIFYYILAAHARREPRKRNGECTMLSFFLDGKLDYYVDNADNDRIRDILVEQSRSNPDFARQFMALWKEDEAAFDALWKEISQKDLRSLSDSELIALNDRFGETYLRRVTSSSVIDGFALRSDSLIARRIQDHVRSLGRESEFNSMFSILTAPVHPSFTNDAEVSLLKMAQHIERDPKLLVLFMERSPGEVLEALSAHPAIYQELSAHQQNFFWLHNNYVDSHILPLEYFIGEIQKLFLEGHDLDHDLGFILNHPISNNHAKEKLIAGLQLPPDLIALLRYSEDFTHWQDERKKATFFATHIFTLILDEAGRRTGFETRELKHLLPYELPLLFSGQITRKQLQQRLEDTGVLIMTPDEVAFVHGPEAARFYDQVKRLDIPKDLRVIKGLPASLGKVTGTVRVIKSAREISKLQPGDILVAVMTRPDYVVGMKKAAAIVTDEGGLTCHAAIVSREFRLPCVIATRFATHVLFDGDQVEVDADQGEVRILERAKK